MDANNPHVSWGDPDALIAEATRILNTEVVLETAAATTATSTISRAHQLISPDLYIIERLKGSGLLPDYANLFGAQVNEKLAALVFLAKQKLLDIEHSTLESRDIADAKRDLAQYVEILFHLQAIDALAIFYDFAAAQRDSRVPRLWRNVCAHCLHLMSLIEAYHNKIAAFLDDRPAARRMLDELTQSTTQQVAGNLQRLATRYQEMQYTGTLADANAREQAPYIAILQQYEQALPAQGSGEMSGSGLSSLLTAQDRIVQAVNERDVPAVAQWITEGSPAATRTALRTALTVMPTDEYINMMEGLITQPMDAVRLAAIVLELGELSRHLQANGGHPRINQILCELALTNASERLGVARLAVKELSSVNAHAALMRIMAQAPFTEVAIQCVQALKELRHLMMAEAIVRERTELLPVFQEARHEVMHLQSLLDSACACPSPDMAEMYLQQLLRLRAIPELNQICMQNTEISEIARQLLAKARMNGTLDRHIPPLV